MLPNERLIIARSRACSIHNLPDELLSHVFELGGDKCDGEHCENDSDEGSVLYFWDGQKSHPISKREGNQLIGNQGNLTSQLSRPSHENHSSPSFRAAISLVCRLWHDIAVSIPSLWTAVAASPNKHSFEHVQTQLKRSRDLPIDIHVHGGRNDDGPSVTDLRTLYTLLMPHVHRWRSIDVDVSDYQHVYAFLDAISSAHVSAAPLLTSLRMHDADGVRWLNNTWNTRLPTRSRSYETLFGGSVPLLRNLALCRAGLDWDQPWITSLSNLTSLELRNHRYDARPTWRQFASVLRGTPLLKKLTLYWSGASSNPNNFLLDLFFNGPDAQEYQPPVPLLHLTDLTFSEDPGDHLMGLLRNIYAPSLKNLTIMPQESYSTTEFIEELTDLPGDAAADSDDDEDFDYDEEPPKFLNNLEHLAFLAVKCMGDSEPLELLFDELSNLKSLHLKLPIDWLSTPVYFKLLLPEGDRVRMPLLETLVIGSYSEKITIPLRRVVQERKDAGFPLKSLYLQKTCRRFDDEDLRWFKENSVTVSLFCLCLNKSCIASACWDHPKAEYGQPGNRLCNCCPPPDYSDLKVLKDPTEWYIDE